MKKSIQIFIIVITFSFPAFSQSGKISLDSIRNTENLLRVFADSINLGVTDQSKNAGLAAFNPTLMDLLQHPETFNYPFDSIKSLSKLKSPNGRIRIYTWTIKSRADGTYRYFGLIQKMDPKTLEMKLIGLVEKKYATSVADTSELLPEEWYGAVYYDIIEKKINKQTCYFLLGWHGNDRLTTRKVIDVLCVTSYNTFRFGSPVFLDENKKTRHRIIFEFTSDAVMLLRYDKKKKMIVFDHLSPANPGAKDQYRFYGPDFTYDGYMFKKGTWIYKSNLDMKNSGDRK